MFVGDISVDMAALGRSRLLTFFSHHEYTTLLMPVQLCLVEQTSINIHVLVMFVSADVSQTLGIVGFVE